MKQAARELLEAERLVESALQSMKGRGRQDWVERLNASLRWIDSTREAVAFEANRIEAIRSASL